MSRRGFVQASLLSGAALAGLSQVTTRAVAAPRAASRSWYTPNASPLAPAAFLRLPPGSVTASGWLAGRLRAQLAGLNGRYQEISHFLDIRTSGWTVPANTGWEEVPYWLRGYGDLAYVTGDATALSGTEQWINGILATAQSDGFLGPTALRTSLNGGPDFWPYLPLVQALRSFQEYSGDARIVPALTAFFRYMHAQPGSCFASSWVSYRLADALDSIYWLFNRTGDSFLLDLADTLHANGANWVDNLPTPHNVNIAQGFREPALYAVRSGDSDLVQASYRGYDSVMGTYGQFPGGGFAADENARSGHVDPRQGFETCGIVEFMASHELLTRLTGDPVWADRCEELAFNSLPAALDPAGTGVHYITSANSVDLSDLPTTQGQFDNSFAMRAYMAGVDQYRCCPHNYGMGWPYFTEELWLAAPDGGLCAAMYAPSEVTAKVADGTAVTFTERTDYPFADTVTLTLSTPRTVTFPLHLRIPGWCDAPVLRVGGEQVAAAPGPALVRIERAWNDGDTVTLQLPQQTRVRTWSANHDSVSVDRGPLTYALRIGEKYVRTGGSDTFPTTEVHATTPWNYGLELDPADPAGPLVFSGATGPVPDDPFTQDTVPVHMTAPARTIAAWQADGERVVATLRPSPALGDGTTGTVTLVPMGAARLRVSSFPTVSADGAPWTTDQVRVRNVNSGKVLAVDGMSGADSARVVQFADSGTADHLWQLIDNGDGFVRVRNANSGKVLGVDGMSTADSAHVVQFTDNGTADHLWQLIDNGDGAVRIRNANSGKVLGVDGMSTADSAQVVQFTDNGTADHLWQLL
ncbi:RICIN domain-containing protein [Streptomyces sp. DW26H14]|uniref:RICIN domain-containing protein n=1 Tax=Streptomyces sp. DW26H14 TaxID=3435395 RepID=UPI00403DE783